MELGRCSVDRLTILGYANDRFKPFIENSIFVLDKRSAKLPYKEQWHCVDGSLIQLGDKDIIRYDFNPNNVRSGEHEKHVFQLLKTIKHARLSRIDIAFDFYGHDLSEYTWLDYRSRKRNYWTDSSNKLETLYIGAKDSEWKIRIYDKAKEQKDDTGLCWWRIEAQLRAGFAEDWEDINPFDGLLAVKSNFEHLDVSWDMKAKLEYLMNHPEQFAKLAKGTKSKFKQLLGAYGEYLPVDIQQLYKKQKKDLRAQVHDWIQFCPVTI